MMQYASGWKRRRMRTQRKGYFRGTASEVLRMRKREAWYWRYRRAFERRWFGST